MSSVPIGSNRRWPSRLRTGACCAGRDGALDDSVKSHAGGILCATCSDGERLITGGDDGRVVATAVRRRASTEIAKR